MVNSGSVEAASKSPGSRGFDLAEFPPLGEGQAGAVVAGSSAIDSGNFLGKSPTLSVFQKTADRLWGDSLPCSERLHDKLSISED
ncbi:hypothetical protein V6N13_091218 [Hibiscus sabdariffa]